jgi:hypothetical protein
VVERTSWPRERHASNIQEVWGVGFRPLTVAFVALGPPPCVLLLVNLLSARGFRYSPRSILPFLELV